MKKLSMLIGLALALPMSAQALTINHVSTYTEECGVDAESCAEIGAYDATSSRVFVTNAEENELRILDIDVNGNLSEFAAVDLSPYGGGPNSVAVSHGVVAVAVEADNKQANGQVVLLETDGTFKQTITAGALPDMLTFTPDGNYLLVANEGEPNDDYTVDPEGSVTVINTATWTATTADFNAFDNAKLKNVRVFGPNASVSQDLEPEYIAVSADSTTAWIALQENNALAKLDIASATITDVFGLGYKVHSQKKNAFDATNKDDENVIDIKTHPTYGMYQPDAIATYQRDDATFILSANEGDARDYDGYSEEVRVKDLILDPKAFPNAEALQEDENLGRLKTTTSQGDTDGDGDFDKIYSYGARSFSIWNANGKRVYDSGSLFERTLEKAQEANLGADIWEDGRSDDKGPEPESITVGELGGEAYAFIGMERTNDIFIYSLENPTKPTAIGFMDIDNVNGDIGPEGLVFVEKDANTGWLIVTSEISNTTSVYEITK